MGRIATFFDNFKFLHETDILAFDSNFNAVYNNEFDSVEIELIREKLEGFRVIDKTFISLKVDLKCKCISVSYENINYYVVVRQNGFFTNEQVNPLIRQVGAFLDSLNIRVLIVKDKEVIFRNKLLNEYLQITRNHKEITRKEEYLTTRSLLDLENFLDMKQSGELVLEMYSPDGGTIVVTEKLSHFYFEKESYFISFNIQIDDVGHVENAFIEESQYLKHVIETINEGVIVLDSNNKIQLINNAALDMTGLLASQTYDKPISNYLKILDSNRQEIDFMNQTKYFNNTALLYRSDGMLWNIALSINSFYKEDEKYLGKVMTISDLSDTKKREREILYLSYHDVLTGLYNRTYLEETINRLDTRRQLPFSIIMGDVNGLKITNDVFGHDAGDDLLRVVSRMLKLACRDEDIVGRWGGDEFVILLPKTSEDEVLMITKRINRSFNDLEEAQSIHGIMPSISIGYGIKHSENENIYDSLKEAETNMYKRKMLVKDSMHSSIISSMKTALYEKSHETEEHTNRIYKTCSNVAKKYKLSSDELNDLELLCMLHDVGKIGVADEILKLPKPLSGVQWEEMKKHPEIGFRIANATPSLKKVANYILYHHERFDGTGYPKGLKGYEIPLLDRILSVGDAYDAMTSDRVYRKAISKEEAIKELIKHSGTQFDPEVVKLFIEANK